MYRCSCHILLTKRGKNFSLTLIPTNTEWIDAAFNLVCILKEWEFPAITEGIPKKKKKRQTSLFEYGAPSTRADRFNLKYVGGGIWY